MKTKTKERTLIHEDKTVSKTMWKDLVRIRPALEKLEQAYAELEIGPFSNEIFHEILTKGTSSIKKRFISSTEEDIKKTGVTKSHIKKSLMNGAEEEFQKFQRQVDAVKEFNHPRSQSDNIPVLKLADITYYDYGAFEISPEDDEKILEHYCRIYLEGPEEHETYKKVQDFLSAFEDLKTNLDKLGFIYSEDNKYGLNSISNSFLDFKKSEPAIKPSAIRWAVSGQKEWEAEKKRQRERTNEYLRKSRPQSLDQL